MSRIKLSGIKHQAQWKINNPNDRQTKKKIDLKKKTHNPDSHLMKCQKKKEFNERDAAV